MHTSHRPEANGVSGWTVVSLVLLPLAIIFLFLPLAVLRGAVEGDPAGLENMGRLAGCWLGAGLCLLIGVISGWIGIRRYRGDSGMPWAAFSLHSAIWILGIAAAVAFVVARW
jgi:hypothetical protein